jgi:hypothetical protein
VLIFTVQIWCNSRCGDPEFEKLFQKLYNPSLILYPVRPGDISAIRRDEWL